MACAASIERKRLTAHWKTEGLKMRGRSQKLDRCVFSPINRAEINMHKNKKKEEIYTISGCILQMCRYNKEHDKRTTNQRKHHDNSNSNQVE